MATSRTSESSAARTEDSGAPSLSPRPPNWWGGVRHYIHEVSLEMKKVSWPTQTEVINTTLVVILAVFFFAVFLLVTDLVLAQGIHLLEAGAKKIFG